MRARLVVPVNEEIEFVAERTALTRHQQVARPITFYCADKTINEGYGAMLAYGTRSVV